jgi:hypothetical protein
VKSAELDDVGDDLDRAEDQQPSRERPPPPDHDRRSQHRQDHRSRAECVQRQIVDVERELHRLRVGLIGAAPHQRGQWRAPSDHDHEQRGPRSDGHGRQRRVLAFSPSQESSQVAQEPQKERGSDESEQRAEQERGALVDEVRDHLVDGVVRLEWRAGDERAHRVQHCAHSTGASACSSPPDLAHRSPNLPADGVSRSGSQPQQPFT